MMNKSEPPQEALGSLREYLIHMSPSAIPLGTVSHCSLRFPSQKIQPLRQQTAFRGQKPLSSALKSF